MGSIRDGFGKCLMYHRSRLGLTQAKLAEMIETSPSYIGHLERGEREPSLVTIEDLSRALHVQPGELFLPPPSDDERSRAEAELHEILRARPAQDLRIVIRLARAVFEDGRLEPEPRPKREVVYQLPAPAPRASARLPRQRRSVAPRTKRQP